MIPHAGQPQLSDIYQQIRKILTQARSRAWRAVNTKMVAAYWEIGRILVEEDKRARSALNMESG